jgi:hypothetical protein
LSQVAQVVVQSNLLAHLEQVQVAQVDFVQQLLQLVAVVRLKAQLL